MDTVLAFDTLNKLNASRKADRAHIAHELRTIADKYGAICREQEKPASAGYCGQSIHMLFTLNGVGAMLDISNIHGGTYALVHWYNELPRNTRYFSPAFAIGVMASIGRPHHKATSHPRTWFELALCLDRGLSLAASGEAFAEPA